MRKLLYTVTLLGLVAGAPVLADDFGAVISGGGVTGWAGVRTDGGNLSYWIVLDSTQATGASIGGTNLGASFSGGYAAGTVAATAGDLDGQTVQLQGVNAFGTLERTAEGTNGGPELPPGTTDTGDTSACDPDTALCIGPFEVTLVFTLPEGPIQGVPNVLTEFSGFFTIFDPTNPELVVKVLDACNLQNAGDRFWIFLAGLTNVQSETTVRDTATGLAKVYTSAAEALFPPVADVVPGFQGICPEA